MKKLILASQSPRRRELLEKCGIPFLCDPAGIDESFDHTKPVEEEIRRLAMRKAEAGLIKHPDAVVVGSDTIVVLNGTVLGKPADEKDAEHMLKMLSGNTHQVVTGLCIMSEKKVYTDVSVADVTFAELDEEEIRSYIASKEPMDKAGAYAVQGLGGKFITGISGDYYTIVGLPLNMVYEELKNLSEY